ncbi:MAG TPA: hypothetical protein VMR52_03045 [Dehalococcoidia bacterium]|nr:hypothetical protein [Dehalococcoidia bacterium]
MRQHDLLEVQQFAPGLSHRSPHYIDITRNARVDECQSMRIPIQVRPHPPSEIYGEDVRKDLQRYFSSKSNAMLFMQ